MFPLDFFLYKHRNEEESRNDGIQKLGKDHFSKLPDELVLKILRFLPPKTIGRCSTVCRKFSTLVQDKSLWKNVDVLGKCLTPESVTEILLRKPEFLRMAKASIAEPVGLPLEFQSSQLVYLDLSMAYVEPEVLALILNSCTSLVKGSFESLVISTEALKGLERCGPTLDTLNFALCSIMDAEAFAKLLKTTTSLTALNVGFIQNEWTNEGLTTVIKCLPKTIQHLNFSGFKTLLMDSDVACLIGRVPLVTDLDLSDSQLLTEDSICFVTQHLKYVQHLAFSRCYNIPAGAFNVLEYVTTLRHLEIFSLFREEAVNQLILDLPGIGINECPFSSVARPTIANQRNTIWGHRVRFYY